MRLFRYIIIFVIFSGSSFAGETYLACDTSKGSVSIFLKDGIVNYSFEKPGKPVFVFKSKNEKNNEFLYSHYSRFQTDYFNVSFVNHDYKYSIFSNYEDENETQGVTVLNEKTGKEFTFKCEKTSIDRLSELSSILQCDKKSSLGCQP